MTKGMKFGSARRPDDKRLKRDADTGRFSDPKSGSEKVGSAKPSSKASMERLAKRYGPAMKRLADR